MHCTGMRTDLQGCEHFSPQATVFIFPSCSSLSLPCLHLGSLFIQPPLTVRFGYFGGARDTDPTQTKTSSALSGLSANTSPCGQPGILIEIAGHWAQIRPGFTPRPVGLPTAPWGYQAPVPKITQGALAPLHALVGVCQLRAHPPRQRWDRLGGNWGPEMLSVGSPPWWGLWQLFPPPAPRS